MSEEVTIGGITYTPIYGPDGLDQFGRRKDGTFSDPVMEGPKQAPSPRKANAKVPKEAAIKQAKAMDGSGRSIGECWHDLLLLNETTVPQRRMVDEELEATIKELFPESYIRPAPKARGDYNRGDLPCQKRKKPKLRSYRYLRVDGTLYRMNSRGGVAQEWNLEAVILGESERK